MTVRKIVVWPDPALAEVAKPVATFDDGLRALVSDMFDTMYKARGIGLAATQVAVPQRVITIDLDPRNDAQNDPDVAAELAAWGFKGPLAVINPEIVSTVGALMWEEGCLSFPGASEEIRRAERVKVKALDQFGKPFELEADGLLAIAVQHENDHLNGVLMIDKLNALRRRLVSRKVSRFLQEEASQS